MKLVALAGGVGGAKLADGLANIPEMDGKLTVVVNTGDDFTHCGLRISPDLDTVCYTLSRLANNQTGWGRSGETWQAFENLKRLGGPAWFQLGDQDLGTHLERTRRLQAGEKLSAITLDFCAAWGVTSKILPMTDDIVETWVEVEDMGWISFQEYFVKHGCNPLIRKLEFRGIEKAMPASGVIAAIDAADVIVVCPSNPFVSIRPIISVEGIAQAIRRKNVIVAVSPIIGGKALKGPAAKMFTEFGRNPSALEVAREYRDWITGFILDEQDAIYHDQISQLGMATKVADTIMVGSEERMQLAREVLAFAKTMVHQGIKR